MNAFDTLSMQKPESNLEALTSALYLSIIAPTHEQADKAGELADWFAARMTPAMVDKAKGRALRAIKHHLSGTTPGEEKGS